MIIGTGVTDVSNGSSNKDRGNLFSQDEIQTTEPQDTVIISQTVPDQSKELTTGKIREMGGYLSGHIPQNLSLTMLQQIAGCSMNLPVVLTVLALLEETGELKNRLKKCGVEPIEKPIRRIQVA